MAIIPESTEGNRLKYGKTVKKGAGNLAFELGWAAIGAVGFHLGNSVRAEGEFSYTRAGVREVGRWEASDFSEPSRSALMSLMMNGLYDLDTGSPIRPFIGLGVGLALVTHSFGRLKSPSVFYPEPYGDATGTAVAYQARVGVAYQLSDRMAIHLGYRLLGAHPALTYLEPVESDRYDAVIRSLPSRALAVQRIEVGMTWSLTPFHSNRDRSA